MNLVRELLCKLIMYVQLNAQYVLMCFIVLQQNQNIVTLCIKNSFLQATQNRYKKKGVLSDTWTTIFLVEYNNLLT